MMKLITIKEVSEILGVKVSTLYEWVRNDTIPSYRLNGLIRFDTKELYVWIKTSNTKNTKERHSHKRTSKNNNLDKLITNAIETVNVKGYNSSQRETRQDQGHACLKAKTPLKKGEMKWWQTQPKRLYRIEYMRN